MSAPRQTAMLSHVAVTCVRLNLDREGLAWIGEWLSLVIPALAGATARARR